MNHLSDTQLVDHAQNAGDRSAFEELVRRHQSNLRYSLRQLTNWNDALTDDLAQETFLQAFQKLHTFRSEAKFSSWLYRIGYNQFLQMVRKKKLDTEELQSEPVEARCEDKGAVNLHQALSKAMSLISSEARSVMHLLLHQQCTQQEISDIMGIPLGTVKTHINRSRPILQAQLTEWRD